MTEKQPFVVLKTLLIRTIIDGKAPIRLFVLRAWFFGAHSLTAWIALRGRRSPISFSNLSYDGEGPAAALVIELDSPRNTCYKLVYRVKILQQKLHI